MSNLVSELKSEHETIVNILTEVKNLGITTKEAQELLMSAKAGLLAHLAKEDKQLYPTLQKEAENNTSLKSTLDTYADEMNGISQAALDFFDKYRSGGDGLEFAKDFGRLFATLASRIRKEESVIYTKYDELVH